MIKKKTERWIRRTHLFEKDEYVCPVCGYSAGKPSPACPKCGKPMKGVRYEATWVDETEDFEVPSKGR